MMPSTASTGDEDDSDSETDTSMLKAREAEDISLLNISSIHFMERYKACRQEL